MGRTKRMRGRRTHGRGKKSGRGAGLRGGRGQAGLLKHKFKKMLIEDPDHFGSRGFTRHGVQRTEERPINLWELEKVIPDLAEEGHATSEGKGYAVNLESAGYTKLLGGGQVRMPLRVRVGAASRRAMEKVSKAGGQVIAFDEEE